jgi:cytidine deaminase
MAKTKTRTAKSTSEKGTSAKSAKGTSAKSAKRTSAKSTRARPGKHAAESSLLDQLVQRAKAVRENAHAPYSRYRVGAAIATKRGRIFEGCNVENASFGATICAERGAIMQMVAAGERDLVACAVVTEDGGSPCGICRQVLSEFARDIPVVLVGADSPEGESGHVVQLADLLPLAFQLRP